MALAEGRDAKEVAEGVVGHAETSRRVLRGNLGGVTLRGARLRIVIPGEPRTGSGRGSNHFSAGSGRMERGVASGRQDVDGVRVGCDDWIPFPALRAAGDDNVA